MRGVHSYMGLTHIPDIGTQTSSAEGNPFDAPKTTASGESPSKLTNR